MKNSIRRIGRSLTEKPILGKPLRFLVAIVRLPRTRYTVSRIGNRLRAIDLEISTIKEKIEHRENMDKEINHQISEVRQEIAEIHKQNRDISSQILDLRSQINDSSQRIGTMGLQFNDTRQQVEVMVHQVNGLIHHRMLFESDVMPGITGALQYQENLMKSLPVVLRRHERKLRELEI